MHVARVKLNEYYRVAEDHDGMFKDLSEQLQKFG